jgi:RimJ/RimL family protein N-acetyltransferase
VNEEIKGKRVLLRKKKLEDAWADYAWKQDPELARLDATIPLDLPFSMYLISYAEELNQYDGRTHTYAIETLDGKHIGNCSYYNLDRDRREAEMGILIGEASCWDSGYGTDAVAALVRYAFTKESLKRMYLHTLVKNIRAQRCFRKCGFLPCRRVTRAGHDFIRMEINEQEVRSIEGSKPDTDSI